MRGTEYYCPTCWEKVTCNQCGSRDTKGEFHQGRWVCQACRHRATTRKQGSLYEDCHRSIIEDCNGASPQEEVSEQSVKEANRAQYAYQQELEEEEEEADEVAPLPMPAKTRQTTMSMRDAPAKQGHVVLLIDASGSMRICDVDTQEQGKQADTICRLEAATQCAADFIQAHFYQHPRDRFSVATFGDASEIVARAANSTGAREALDGIGRRGVGGTSFLSALQAATELLDAAPGMQSHVVILSDGRPADTKKALKLFQEEFLWGKYVSTPIHGIGFGATVQSFAPLQQLCCLSGGSFVLSTCSMQGLGRAFSSVSSTITTSMSSGWCDEHGKLQLASKHKLRPVIFEPPEIGDFGRKDVLRFHADRTTFQYDGNEFQTEKKCSVAVARREHPCMRGGMRLVYAFRDTHVVKDEGSWMVAKASRFLDEVCNCRAVVESHAKSTAVARHYAARFNERLRHVHSRKHQEDRKPHTVFFVPCHFYEAAETDRGNKDEATFFTAERFLPGAFLKYNSNNGYVCDDSVQHHEAVQAFTHFSFMASGGNLLVADLQGVALENETLLTDPQVLSQRSEFGPGDLGPAGMKACLSAHRCGPTCRRLGLEPLTAKALSRLPVAKKTAPSSASSSWASFHYSELGQGDQWEKVSESRPAEYALSEAGKSSQGSGCSWVHLLET